MRRKIIIVSGSDRVGKSTLGAILALADCLIFECGEYVRNKAKEEQDQSISLSEYYENNMDRLDAEIACQIQDMIDSSSTSKAIVAVGVRSQALLDRIFKIGCETIVVFVYSSFQERFNRNLTRRVAKEICDESQFRLNDARQNSWGLKDIAGKADITLANSGSLQDFVCSIESIKAKIC